MPFYGYLADAVVAFHVGYVAFIVVGQLLIVLGWILRWSWIKNFGFRLSHLLAIGIVAVESMSGMTCPLTTLEDRLREWAGQEVSQATFMGRCLHALIFHDLPQSYFDMANVVFALIVVATFLAARPRLPRRSQKALA
ncbi:MAG: DUF2784 domain-containing protein [Gemmataceae bacterium]